VSEAAANCAHEIALVAVAVGIGFLAASEQLAVVPLAAGYLRAVRPKLFALSVGPAFMDTTDVVAAAGQQQHANVVCGWNGLSCEGIADPKQE
jgi:hypothetical protein